MARTRVPIEKDTWVLLWMHLVRDKHNVNLECWQSPGTIPPVGFRIVCPVHGRMSGDELLAIQAVATDYNCEVHLITNGLYLLPKEVESADLGS